MVGTTKKALDRELCALNKKADEVREARQKFIKAEQRAHQTELVKSGKVRISTSYGRSTDYVEEYWVEDMEGNAIEAGDFPPEWGGRVFQVTEEITNAKSC